MRLTIAAVGVLALLIGVASYLQRDAATPAAADTQALFAQTFDDADGRPQAVASWRGKVLVVNFWATWCAPCVDEMPELQAVHNDYAPRGAAVVGVAIDNAAAVREFGRRLKLTMPLLVAGTAGSELARQLGNPSGALPYTVVIDADGRIVRGKLGRLREPELRSWLDRLLSELPRSG